MFFGMVILYLLVAIACRGATVTFAWDQAQYAESYYMAERVGTNYVKLPGTHTTNLLATATNLVAGQHVFNCFASNMWGISLPSADVLTPAALGQVQNPIITVGSILQQSPYPQGPWLDVAVLGDIPARPTNGFIFYRVQMRATR
jgi:hypothetical protein